MITPVVWGSSSTAIGHHLMEALGPSCWSWPLHASLECSVCWQKQQAASARGEEPEDEFTLSMWLTTLSESYDKLRKKDTPREGAESPTPASPDSDIETNPLLNTQSAEVIPPPEPAVAGSGQKEEGRQ